MVDHEQLLKLFTVLDLTSLGDSDSEHHMYDLLDFASFKQANVAALCTYSKFVTFLSEHVSPDKIKLATVANFPSGDASIEAIQDELEEILELPIQELDFVLPYQRLLDGHIEEVIAILQFVIQTCHERDILVKVIMESGAFKDKEVLYRAALMVLECGADFLKTSTGKIDIGARIEDVKIFCEAIKDYGDTSRGIKVSGGVRSIEDAQSYYDLVAHEMGEDWPSKHCFRIGASALAGKLIESLDKSCI